MASGSSYFSKASCLLRIAFTLAPSEIRRLLAINDDFQAVLGLVGVNVEEALPLSLGVTLLGIDPLGRSPPRVASDILVPSLEEAESAHAPDDSILQQLG